MLGKLTFVDIIKYLSDKHAGKQKWNEHFLELKAEVKH